MIKKYPVEVVSVENIEEGIYCVSFKSLTRSFKYNPGQFLHLTIDEFDGVGQWTESRCFSMQSSPNDSNIKITYSVVGKYTKRMSDELVVGKKVWLKLPYGDLFTKEHNKNNSVFIAGGKGITPFLSLFCDSSFANYQKPVLLFGLRSKKFNIYKEELQKAKQINPGFSFELFLEDENGRPIIQEELIKQDNVFFISGPPAMINHYKQLLLGKGIQSKNIITDDWE